LQEKLTNNYFLDSANNVTYLFEEGAFDSHGNLQKPKALSTNKMSKNGQILS
jgi:phytanoyl-CoA hydroxylase